MRRNYYGPVDIIDGFPIVNERCKYIFLGSSTTLSSKMAGFPYMSSNNRISALWRLLDYVLSSKNEYGCFREPSTKDEFEKLKNNAPYTFRDLATQYRDGKITINEIKEELNTKLNLGLLDMIKKCHFVKNRSSDADIVDDDYLEFNDVSNYTSIIFILNGGENSSSAKREIINRFLDFQLNSKHQIISVINIFNRYKTDYDKLRSLTKALNKAAK